MTLESVVLRVVTTHSHSISDQSESLYRLCFKDIPRDDLRAFVKAEFDRPQFLPVTEAEFAPKGEDDWPSALFEARDRAKKSIMSPRCPCDYVKLLLDCAKPIHDVEQEIDDTVITLALRERCLLLPEWSRSPLFFGIAKK